MNYKQLLKEKIDAIISDIKSGTPVIVVDDYSRENEGDLVIAGERATCENLAFMKREAGGLMCVPASGNILNRLNIGMMVDSPSDPHNTPFTITVDAAKGTTTGMCVSDRLKVVNVLLDDNSLADELTRPGHMFPLRPKAGLLKERRGHTEASIELVRLAGFKEVAIIIEIMNADGTMSRLPELEMLAEKHNLKFVSIEEIMEHVYNKSV